MADDAAMKCVLNNAKLDIHEEEWFLKAPWGKIAVLAWGDSTKQPIVMCHGRLDSAATFRPLIKQLPQSFYYISFDLPGNGKSDSFPKGMPLSVLDYIYSLKTLIDNLSLKKFAYIGHSLGSGIGRLYHLSHPNHITRLVDLDPFPAYVTHEPSEFKIWHQEFQGFFKKENYEKFNASSTTSPKYTNEQVFELLKKSRGLTDEATSIALERVLQPAGDGLYQLLFDQRQKIISLPPFSSQYLQELYTSICEPTLTVLAEDTVKKGKYSRNKFLFDESLHKSKNYFVEIVEGNHDVHLSYPERMAPLISKFLTSNFDS